MSYDRPRLRWRDYRTAAGNSPVGDFIRRLDDYDAAQVLAAMREVRDNGLRVARQLRGDVYEVRANGQQAHYRLLFSLEGRRALLALDIFDKDTNKTPENVIRRAQARLADWRARG